MTGFFYSGNMKELLEKIKTSRSFLIMGHEDPDGDSICSAWAMGHVLERMGKKVQLCSPGRFRRREIEPWLKPFSTELPPLAGPEAPDLLILMDCSSLSRTGYDPALFQGLPLMVLDHHASGTDFGDYRLVRPGTPSTTLIVQDLCETLAGPLTPEEAEAVFMGFCTDTDFFRHLGPGNGDVFQNLTRLAEYGIDPSSMDKFLQPVYSRGTVRLMGRILDRAEWHCKGRLAVSQDSFRDRTELETEDRNSPLLYKILFSVEGTEAVMLLQENEPGRWFVGFRSLGGIDVGKLAADLGGGGHRNASGCEILTEPGESPTDRLIGRFRELWDL